MRASPLVLGVAVLVGALAACGAKRADGPAWPKSAGRMEVEPEKDGGESLEPQQASHIAAVERAEDRTPAVAAPIEVTAPEPETPKDAKDKPSEPTTEKPASPPTGEVQIEVIEIRPEDIQIDR